MEPGLRGQDNLSPPTSCLISGGKIPYLRDETSQKLQKHPSLPRPRPPRTTRVLDTHVRVPALSPTETLPPRDPPDTPPHSGFQQVLSFT